MQEFQISILLILLCVLSCFHGYRILKSGETIPDGAYFRPFSKVFNILLYVLICDYFLAMLSNIYYKLN